VILFDKSSELKATLLSVYTFIPSCMVNCKAETGSCDMGTICSQCPGGHYEQVCSCILISSKFANYHPISCAYSSINGIDECTTWWPLSCEFQRECIACASAYYNIHNTLKYVRKILF
jgi:hypothetical protein